MDKIKKAFDAEEFRSLAHQSVDLLADYFRDITQGKGKVIDWQNPLEREKEWKDISENGNSEVIATFRRVIQESMHLHHPRFMGHQQGTSLPLSALCDFVTSALSNSSGVFEMGPPGTVLEHKLIQWMGKILGFPEGAAGFLTSGGTLGNLTALLAARSQKVPGSWEHGDDSLSILVSEHAHYSIDRAARVMGLGKEGAIRIPVDEQFRMKPQCLEAAKAEAEKKGRKVFAVVASDSNTATGTFDPIPPIADFCEKHGLWLHVDGAHGASTVLSQKYKKYLKGVERADSITWDIHKMLLNSALATAVIFKKGTHSYETFSQEASYVLEKKGAREWYNLVARTFETTKRDLALRLYLPLQVYGVELYDEYITRCYDLARTFAEMIRAEKDFELAAEPESNILCFRLKGADGVAIRRKIIQDGKFYLVQTQLPSGHFLRTTLINPFSTEEDLRALLAAIRAAAS